MAEGEYKRNISQGSVSGRICSGIKSVLHTIREQDGFGRRSWIYSGSEAIYLIIQCNKYNFNEAILKSGRI